MASQPPPWERYSSPQPSAPQVIQGPPRMPAPQTPAQEQGDVASAAAAAANANRTQAITPGDVQGRDLENRLRLLEVQRGGLTADQQRDADRSRADLEAMAEQLQRVGDIYNRNFRDSDPLITLGLSENEREFDRNSQMLRQQAQAAFRIPGVGSTSDYDARLLEQAYGLGSTQWDVDNEAVLDGLQTRLNQRRAAAGLPPVDWRQSRVPDSNTVQPGDRLTRGEGLPGLTDSEREAGMGQNVLSNEGGSFAREADIARAREQAGRATALARSGASPAQINAYLRSVGRDPLSAEQIQTLNNFRRAGQLRRHPGFAPDVIPTGQNDPNLTTGVANSPYGAAVINAGDAMTFGLLDNVTADPERTRAAMELQREQHPVASFVGQAAGAIVPGGLAMRGTNALLGGSRAAGGLNTIGEMAARPLGNALYGAGYGAGSADQNGGGFMERLEGAGRGAALSAVGGEVGGRAVAGAGRALTGVRDAGVRALTDRGVPLTLGQIASGGGAVGRAFSKVEDALESVPLLGSAIRARRLNSLEGFNRATYDEALAPIGANTGGRIGEEGADAARAATRQGYRDALDGVEVRADTAFATALTNIQRKAANMPPDLQAHYNRWLSNRLAPALQNGRLTGTAYQALRQELRQDARAIAGNLGERELKRVLSRTEAALSGLMRRQSPDVRSALRAADTAYRRTRIARDATGKAVNSAEGEGGVFTPAQLGTAAEANARRLGSGQASTTRPFFELQREGQRILPSKVPNSGTVDRAWVTSAFPAIASGAGYQTGLIDADTALLFAGLGLPYTRTGQRKLQQLLVSRPARVRQIGEAIIARRGMGSQAGAGGANVITDQTPSPDGY